MRLQQLTYALPDSFLVPGREKVFVDSVRLRPGIDYALNAIQGRLTLQKPQPGGDTLRVDYLIFDFNLRESYFHRKHVFAPPPGTRQGESSSGLPRKAPVPKSRDVVANLKKSGSIVRGISVGSTQDLQVDSGLRLRLSGQLTRDVEVVASLTDQNTPIQPEGNTQTLQEIDNVFVQIKSPHVQGTLGDYTLNLTGGQFTNYQRKLEGVMAEGAFNRSGFKVSAAVSRGQFVTNQFMGQEGNQGPYQLSGENGNINILVLAGTERVWVDGEQMVRGEKNDYIIEYANGQITFTRHRLITQDSRIVVDFQFSDESFQRNYWAAEGKTELLNNKVDLLTTFISESDSKNNPLTIPLGNESLEILQAAGDSLAIVRGDTMVTDGLGVYIRDSTGVFVYVGKGNGNFNVRFSFFGPGRGDYRNIGLGRFEYVGVQQGDYLPFIILPKAQKQEMLGFNLRVAPVQFLELNTDLALSSIDENLYSGIDDDDNRGTAYQVQLRFQPENVHIGKLSLGQLDLSGQLRRKSADFRDIDRSTEAEFDRKWNLAPASSSTQEDILEMQAGYKPAKGFHFRGGLGRLQRHSLFNSRRLSFESAIERVGLPRLMYSSEIINRIDDRKSNESEWFRQRGRAEYLFKWLKPILEFESEIKKDSQGDTLGLGFRFDSYTGGLQLTPWKSFGTSFRYNVRDDKDRTNAGFLDKSLAQTQTYGLNLRNWRAFDMEATFTHRERDFADEGVQDTRTDLADVRIGFRPKSGSARSDLYYQISNTRIAQQDEVYIEVEEGEGSFSFNEELQEYEPDAFGNYVRRLFTTNQFIPVVQLKMQADLRLRLERFFGSRNDRPQTWPAKMLRPFSTESFLRIDERTKEKDVKRIFLLDMSAFRQDSTTRFGSIEFRQDIYLWQNSRDKAVRYRYRNRSELNNQFVAGRQDRKNKEHQIRALYSFSKQTSAQVEYAYSQEDRLFGNIAREDRRVRSHKLLLDLAHRPKQPLELGLKTTLSFNRDIEKQPVTRANLLTFEPRASYSLNNRGRLRAELQWTNVTLSPPGRLIPFELTDGRGKGKTFTWNLGFEYRVSQNMRASFTYFGRNEPDRPRVQHIAKAEVRAFF